MTGYGTATFAGRLAGRVDGVLALWNYVTTYVDGEGNTQEQQHRYTIALAEAPAAQGLFRRRVIQPRLGPEALESVEDAIRDRRRVEVESAALEERFEIFIDPADDLNRARQLLSPAFIDWLTTNSAPGFTYEIEDGWVCVSFPLASSDPRVLDGLSENVAEVAERVAAEAQEAGAQADPSRAPFEPRSVIAASTETRARTRQLSTGLAWLVFTTAVFGTIAIGAVVVGEERDPNAPGAGDRPDAPANPLALHDAALLAAVDLYDQGKGARGADIEGAGLLESLPPAEVAAWLEYASSRNLIAVDGVGRSARITLTAAGREELAGLDG